MKVRLCSSQFLNFSVDTRCYHRPELIHPLATGQTGLAVSCLLARLFVSCP